MASLQDIFNLAKADGGKFFVMDETGDPKLVIMDIDEYQKLLLGKIQQEVDDVETINREIMNAQVAESTEPGVLNGYRKNSISRASLDDVVSEMPQPAPLSATAQKNLQNNHHTEPLAQADEVIDPSFDFEGPKVEIEDL